MQQHILLHTKLLKKKKYYLIKMKLLATDMDRTLLPNGNDKYDNSINLFNKMIEDNNIKIAYVTGRNLNLVKKAIKEYSIKKPDYLICSVGSQIYVKKNERFISDKGWKEYILKKCPTWNYEKISKKLLKVKGLKIQEKSAQNEFKLSYYVIDEKTILNVKKYVSEKNANIVYSWDPLKGIGLLDILPKNVNKHEALKYLISKNKFEDVVYSGDSGNDIDVIKSGVKSILVKNSDMQLKSFVKEFLKNKKTNNIYIAKGNFKIKNKKLNGNYSSGIIEGLKHFKFF